MIYVTILLFVHSLAPVSACIPTGKHLQPKKIYQKFYELAEAGAVTLLAAVSRKPGAIV